MKKFALAALLAAFLLPPATFAQVVIRIGPPPAVVERPGPPPEHGQVWIAGYYRYEGDHYLWVPGHWEHPPRRHAVWVPHRWEHHHGEWILIEGHWR
jgi:hypothetical protein